jgi:PAS domain S-box-containing protein
VISGFDEVLVVIRDVTDRKIAQAQIERHAHRTALLAELGRALDHTNRDFGQTLAILTDHIAAAFSTGCAICLVTDDQQALAIAAAGAHDAALSGALKQLEGRQWDANAQITVATLDALDKQHVVASQQLKLADLVSFDNLSTLKAYANCAVTVASLRHHGRLIGAIVLVHDLTLSKVPDEQDVLREVAERAALAIDNALLFQAVQNELSERQRTEYELRESEHRFRQMADGISEAFWLMDLEQREIAYINPAYETIWGRSCRSLTTEPRTWQDAVHPDDYSIVEAAFASHKRGLPTEIEYRIVRPDLTIRWIRDRSYPLAEPSGVVRRLAGIGTDITDRKHAEENLRQSQHYVQRIADLSPVMIYVYDLHEQRHVYINREVQGILGYSPADVLTMGPSFLPIVMHPDDLRTAPQWEVDPALLNDPRGYEWQYRMRHHDGEWRWIAGREAIFTLDAAGCPTQVLGMALDITKRNRFEMDLHEAYTQLELLTRDVTRSRDLLRTLFDALNDGLLLLDRDGNILAINGACAALLQRGVDDLVGLNWSAVSSIESPFPATVLVRETLSDNLPRQARERLIFPNGTHHILDIDVFPVLDTAGNVQETVLRVVDVTERLQLEAQVMEQERFAASGRLAATVAHEVNTPLQAVESCLHMAEKGNSKERSEYLDLARGEIIRVAQILRQLLDVYRPSVAPEPIDLNTLIRRVLMLMSSSFANHGIRVNTELAERLPPILGKTDDLTQVLLNLVVNAIQAMPRSGHLHLRTSTHERPAGDDAQLQPHVVVEISDTGTGIDQEQLNQIFEPFYTTKSDGTGVGLAICRTVVMQHRGVITATSKPGEGSTFTIVLPKYDI